MCIMSLNFNLLTVVDIKNPNKNSTEIYFIDSRDIELKTKSLVVFEPQVKYVITEEYATHKMMKIYILDDEAPIVIDFHPEEYHHYESFFLALYNKNI